MTKDKARIETAIRAGNDQVRIEFPDGKRFTITVFVEHEAIGVNCSESVLVEPHMSNDFKIIMKP